MGDEIDTMSLDDMRALLKQERGEILVLKDVVEKVEALCTRKRTLTPASSASREKQLAAERDVPLVRASISKLLEEIKMTEKSYLPPNDGHDVSEYWEDLLAGRSSLIIPPRSHKEWLRQQKK